VPTSLSSTLIIDLKVRYPLATISEIIPKKEGFLDAGGMIMTDQQLIAVNFGDDLIMSISAIDFSFHLERLKKLNSRNWEPSNGQKYYKIFNRFNCVVVSEKQFERLIGQMTILLDRVEEIAAKETIEFQRRLDQLNAGKVTVLSHRDSKRTERGKGIPSGNRN
jgi:hypothetical protein